MNLSKTNTIISIAVASMVGVAGYAYAQQTGAQQPDSSTTNNPNVPRAAGVDGTSGTTDSNGRMNSDSTTGESSGTRTSERSARADRN